LPARQNGYVTFGSYNALQKLTPVTVALWARVLAAVPRSRLLLKSLAFADEALQRAVRKRFAAAGADPGRIDIVPPTEGSKFLAEYRHMDIALDPFPYNGGTTSCEAMWMGVPVVTRAGKRFCSRMGLSLLESLGLPELIAQDPDHYVRICTELAADLPRLEALRSSLRARMEASPICDAARTARDLEEAYREMWRNWVTSDERTPGERRGRAR
jgi:predicted O-linked N-acetylglucosamine transferase (SPINDLY family)